MCTNEIIHGTGVQVHGAVGMWAVTRMEYE